MGTRKIIVNAEETMISPLPNERREALLAYTQTMLKDGSEGAFYRTDEILSLLHMSNEFDRVAEGLKASHRQSNIRDHAKAEFEAIYGKSIDEIYDGMIEDAVMDLLEVFIAQGHSGLSANITLDMFRKLANFEALSALTCRPTEWVAHSNCYQNKRDSLCFTRDPEFRHYYKLDDRNWFGKVWPWAAKKLGRYFNTPYILHKKYSTGI